MKRKKRIIILSVILSVFAVMIILASTVFMLSKVRVNFLSSANSVLSVSDTDGIIKSGKFNYGGNVLFMKFDKQIARIEAAYPYAKVEKVERKFPNRAIVHISERTPAAYVTAGQYVYVLDSELKVLNVVYADEYNSDNTALPPSALLVPKLVGLDIDTTTTIGTKIENEKVKNILSSVVEGFEKSGKSVSLLSNIKINYNEINSLVLTLAFDDKEMTLVIKGATNLTRKVQVGIQAYLINLETHTTGVLEQISETDINFTWQA